MTRYLLDTNIVSNLMRYPQDPVATRIVRVGAPNVCTSFVVAPELRYGAAKKGSARLTAQLDAILRAMIVVALEVPADRTYGEVRAQLERSGTKIGPRTP